ncbi:MAG: RNA polymerase sigma factor [Chitinophagales bacterium]|nr:RNA polymerase sigma factor [Chitinophagales bacterium]
MMSKTEPHKEIIIDCQNGNRSAQRKLYQHYYAYGMNICLHYSKNREEAQEILNDGFLKVFKKISSYKFKGSFRAWLRRILIHSAIDYFRKHHKEEATLEIIHLREPSVNNSGAGKLELDDVMKLVQQLPPAYRIVFNLHVVEGYTHWEIAQQLGITTGTSKSNLSKARAKLQKAVIALYPEQYKDLEI